MSKIDLETSLDKIKAISHIIFSYHSKGEQLDSQLTIFHLNINTEKYSYI